MDIREIQAKSILTPCGIPGIDYVINPYTGCSFACAYCYASFMGRFVGGKKISDWGNYVFAKVNAPELLTKEIKNKLKNKGKGKEVFMSSVTDPYQGLEAKYKITRQCLKILANFEFEGTLSLLTKSKLVTRDIDVLKQFKHVTVGLTVTSTDDNISRFFEKYAPNVSDRFKALERLNKENIKTYAFIGPLLPHYLAGKQELEKVFQRLVDVGTKDIFIEHLNLSTHIKNRLLHELKDVDQNIIKKFYFSQSKTYRDILNEMILELVSKYKMNLLTDVVIFHKEYQKNPTDLHPHKF